MSTIHIFAKLLLYRLMTTELFLLFFPCQEEQRSVSHNFCTSWRKVEDALGSILQRDHHRETLWRLQQAHRLPACLKYDQVRALPSLWAVWRENGPNFSLDFVLFWKMYFIKFSKDWFSGSFFFMIMFKHRQEGYQNIRSSVLELLY